MDSTESLSKILQNKNNISTYVDKNKLEEDTYVLMSKAFGLDKNHKGEDASYRDEVLIDEMVDDFIKEYKIPDYEPLLRKAFWYLGDKDICDANNAALTARSPGRYLVATLRRMLEKKRIAQGGKLWR